MPGLDSFEDLEVYKKAREFRKLISSLTKTFPKDEQYRLVDQLIRESRSVTAQISEGFGRYHHQENIQFCRIARGSLTEIRDHLNVALDEGLIHQDQHENLIRKQGEVIRILNGYINYLRKAKANQ